MAILIVDADGDVRETLREILQDERPGEVVATAADGASALAMLRDADTTLRLVLLDSRLPGSITADVVRDYIRSAPHLQDVQVMGVGIAQQQGFAFRYSRWERICRFFRS